MPGFGPVTYFGIPNEGRPLGPWSVMFSYLRIFLTVALLAGIGAGVVNWAVHMFGTTPLILEAEVFENAGAAEEPAAAATADRRSDRAHARGRHRRA